MEIPVLIEPIPGAGYRASGGEPFAIIAEGATPEVALARFKGQLATKIHNGASVAAVEVTNEHPWAKVIGIFDSSDPLVHEWLALIEQNRSQPEDVE